MRLYLHGNQIHPDDILPMKMISHIEYQWIVQPHTFYTFIMYGIDAGNAPYTPYVNYLEINIPGSSIGKGTVILEYELPNMRLLNGTMRFIVAVLTQSHYLTLLPNQTRGRFNLDQLVQTHDLYLQEYETFTIDEHSSFKLEHMSTRPLIKTDTLPTTREQKICSCVVEIGGKQTSECNGGQQGPREKSEQACTKSVDNSLRVCYSNYDYDMFSNAQLIAIASLRGIVDTMDRAELIARLQTST
jgi:hypothetical protein